MEPPSCSPPKLCYYQPSAFMSISLLSPFLLPLSLYMCGCVCVRVRTRACVCLRTPPALSPSPPPCACPQSITASTREAQRRRKGVKHVESPLRIPLDNAPTLFAQAIHSMRRHQQAPADTELGTRGNHQHCLCLCHKFKHWVSHLPIFGSLASSSISRSGK